MNGKKRRVGVVLALMAVVALLVSCVPVATTETGAAGAEPAAGEQIVVTYWAHNFEPRVTLDEKYIAEFEAANPNIDVQYEVIPADFDAKLRTALAAGTGPDLFAQWNGDIGTFYAQDAIVPVNAEALGFGSQQELMDLYVAPENTLQGATFDGQLYGIPNEVSIYACYANNDMFEAAGLDPEADFPETWEELKDVAEKLTIRDESGKLTQQGFDFDWGNAVWMLLQYGAMVRQLGGSELEPATPENEKVMQYWVDWATTWGLGGPAYWTGQTTEFETGFTAIKCGIGSWGVPGIEAAGINYSVHKVPVWENAVNNNRFDTYAYFHQVNSKSAPEVQEAAWKLAWELDSHPIEYMVDTGLLQTQKVLQESAEFAEIPNMSLYLDSMAESQYSPRIPQFYEAADVLARARDRSVVEGMPVAESLQIAQEEMTEVLGTTTE